VLFDAIADAAFPVLNNMEGRGSLRDIKEKSGAKAFIARREHIVMPLLTIQQYASSQIIAMKKSQAVDENCLMNTKN
jgi:hypothetical protein